MKTLQQLKLFKVTISEHESDTTTIYLPKY